MDALTTRADGRKRDYDVFLSFRGADTRTGFTDHLYNAILDAGIRVFRDSEEEIRAGGEEIDTETLWAITCSRIAIPIISKGYAKSRCCLRRLAAIMDCRRRYNKLVLPVFDEVDVVDLGSLRGKFDEAHEMSSSEEVLKWQEALTYVASIKGWISHITADGHEAELVQMVVAKVLNELKKMWIQRLPLFIRSVCNFFWEKKGRECQVFLAFRGPSTRHDLAHYLYVSLVASEIGVFDHDDPSLIGKDFSNEIGNAINNCKISIPILSTNYPSSPWCLDELARMVDCMRNRGLKIMPIFYKVDPSYVRDLSHCFGERMLQYKELVDASTYDRWKQALWDVGSLQGWVLNGHEEVLVKWVVKEVVKEVVEQSPNMNPHPYLLNRVSILESVTARLKHI